VAALEATKGPKPLPSQNAAFSAMGPPAGTGQFAAVGFSYGGDGGGVGGGDDGGGSGDEREAEEEESDEEEDAPATAGVPLLLPLPSSAYRLLCCSSCWPHLLLPLVCCKASKPMPEPHCCLAMLPSTFLSP
jgi:hypothetical protein